MNSEDKYLEIDISKTMFDDVNRSDFEILFNRMRSEFKHEYSWTTINFLDGTGIQFIDGNPANGVYGKIDDDCRVTEKISDLDVQKNLVVLPDFKVKENKELPV